MAFIQFADAAPGGLPIAHSALFATARPIAQQRPVISPPVEALLSTLEHRVIELAREDGLKTLRPERKRSWLARLILGPTPPSPTLANERLEALRRLAVQAWHHGYTLPASALKEAREAGYSETQVSAVVDSIGRARPAVRPADRRLAA